MGNARTFLVNWALARQQGWKVLMRIDDLDGPRVKAEADRQALGDLAWLGLEWDGPPTWQRADTAPYDAALAALQRRGLIYPCNCTRSQIKQAVSAPHGDEHELRYPGTCRPKPPMPQATVPQSKIKTQESKMALRLLVPDEDVHFQDELCGPQRVNVQQQVGDFVVATKIGLPAYQLAVVVDDARQNVTEVVRGDDLLRSSARQALLYRLLELDPLPRYWHLPLVLGPDGRRLAKRHGDTRLAYYREQGVPPHRIVGLLAFWSGVQGRREPMDTAQFRERFRIDRLPEAPVTFTKEDHEWLTCRTARNPAPSPQRGRGLG
jgi:glutamyl-tRNA synthetase